MVFKYYILNRPVSIGTQPSRGLINFVNYNQRTFIGEIGREAWGMLKYNRELTDSEVENYELKRGGRNEKSDYYL